MTAATARTDVLEFLHAGSLTAAGVGACCVALDGPRPRVRELALSVVMVLAMLDVVVGARAVPVVAWSALTVLLAMALAVRRRRVSEQETVSRMRLFSSLGAVLMATLMLVMSAGSAPTAAHHQGVAPGAITAGMLMASVGYAIACGAVIRGGRRTKSDDRGATGRSRKKVVDATRAVMLDRVQLGSMSSSVLLLASAYALG